MSPKGGTLAAGPLSVEFAWHEDRFAHVVSWIDGDNRVTLLTSLEGNGQQDWPRSPVFQSLAIDTISGGRTCALLVGMAGKSHWSASIVADADGLTFDIACRVKTPPGALGSCYSCDTVAHLTSESNRFEFSLSGGRMTLSAGEKTDLQHARAGLSPAPEVCSNIPAGNLFLRPVMPTHSAVPCTIRWLYRMTACVAMPE